MNIEEIDILKELSEQTYFGDLPFLYYADLIGKLLTDYKQKCNYIKENEIYKKNLFNSYEEKNKELEKEKEITKNAICFLKYYNNDFNKMSDNEIKQILYNFGKCADIKKEE